MSFHRPRGRARGARLLAGALTLASVASLSLGTGLASAHAGHHHGRVVGKADVKRIGEDVRRYDETSGTYTVERRGRPALEYHVDARSAAGGARYLLPANELAPICATTGHRIVAVWHHPAGAGTAGAPEIIRGIVRRMTWKIRNEASISSGTTRPLRMVVECDASSQIVVREIVSASNDDSDVMRAEVEGALGAPSGAGSVKYLVFRDGPDPRFADGSSAAGVGYGWHSSNVKFNDDAASASSNPNRYYTTSGFTWRRYWETQTTIHELVHTMGGVQTGSPSSSGEAHCTDGQDILCRETLPTYIDSACPAPTYSGATTVPLDCGYNTYFDALTESGEWLSNHWNVGGVENPFLTGPVQSAVTSAATSIRELGATLNGTVNGNGFVTDVRFDYGPTTVYGSIAAAGSGITGAVSPSVALTDLRPGTTYHYRVVATSGAGIVTGSDQTFRTDLAKPSAVNLPGGHRYVFYRSSSDQLMGWHWNGSAWRLEGWGGTGEVTGNVSAVATTDGIAEVFYRAADGSMGRWRIAPGFYQPGTYGAGNVTGTPAAAAGDRGGVEVFYRMTNGQLGRWSFNGAVSNWTGYGYAGRVAGNPAVARTTTGWFEVLYRNETGQMGRWRIVGSDYQDMAAYGDAGAVTGDPTVVSTGSGSVQAFYRKSNGQLGRWWFNGAGWNPSTWGTSIVAGNPSAVVMPSGRIEVVYRTTSDELGRFWFTDSDWNPSTAGGSGSIAGDPVALAVGANVSTFFGTPSGDYVDYSYESAGAGWAWTPLG